MVTGVQKYKYEYKDVTYIYIQLSWSLGYRNMPYT